MSTRLKSMSMPLVPLKRKITVQKKSKQTADLEYTFFEFDMKFLTEVVTVRMYLNSFRTEISNACSMTVALVYWMANRTSDLEAGFRISVFFFLFSSKLSNSSWQDMSGTVTTYIP